MKRHFILGIMAVAALASCNKSEVLNQESLKEKGISFSAYVGKSLQTKAETITGTNVKEAGIGVMAWRTGDADISTSILETQAPEFMTNVLLTWDGTNATYSPDRYWPSTGAKVSFFAYAPYASGAGNETDNIYHPENIKFNTASKAHEITLVVPKIINKETIQGDNPKTTETETEYQVDVQTGVEYANHTDFMVAKVGNGDKDADGKWLGTIGAAAGTDGTFTNAQTVGINQNLNKDWDGKVKFQMKHALSKISFVAKSEDGKGKQEVPYSNGLVKVVFDNIELVGDFANEGVYNLFTQAWKIDESKKHTSYNLVNKESTDNDPFTAIADEVYNKADYEKFDNDWFKLNKTTHDMMLIPVVGMTAAIPDDEQTTDIDESKPAEVKPATITHVKGSYTVKTYKQKVRQVLVSGTEGESSAEYEDKLVYLTENGAETLQNTGIPAVGEEETSYRDVVEFGKDPLANPISLEAGKAYIFQFNIKLNKIEFSVVVEDWENGSSTAIVDTWNGGNQNNGGTGEDDRS